MTRSDDLTRDERAELERLRAEVVVLRVSGGSSVVPARARWRRVVSALLILLGSILLLPGTVALWLQSVVTDTDRFVATVAPLANDPRIQAAAAERITDEVAEAVDVETVVHTITAGLQERGLDPRATAALDGLAGPMASGFEGWLADQVTAVVHSDAFADAWTAANRTAHTQVVSLLTGERGGMVTVGGDRVQLELAPVTEAVQQRLVDRGLTAAERLPAIDTQIVIAESEHLRIAQGAFMAIDRLGRAPAAVAAVLLLAGVIVAPDRRRASVAAGIGAVTAMGALALLLALVRPVYLHALPATVDPAAAAAVFDQLLGFLRATLRALAVAGFAVAAAAFLTGPSVPAVAIRRAALGAARSLDRQGIRERNVVTRWLGRYQRPVQAVLAVAAILTLVFWEYPSGAVVAAVALLTAVLVALVELAAAPEDGATAQSEPEPTAQSEPEPAKNSSQETQSSSQNSGNQR